MILVNQIRLPLEDGSDVAIQKALALLHLSQSNVKSVGLAKISVDARHATPCLVYTVAVQMEHLRDELPFGSFAPNVSIANPRPFVLTHGKKKMRHRPIVCGLGPAGLFCALALAREGYRPIVLERGAEMSQRIAAVNAFRMGGSLAPNANIQFGEGGAGTFSDGKLTTRIRDPLCGYVTETLLKHGAPPEIAIQQKPHIGTDQLRDVIVSLRKEIESLGGTIHFNTPLTGISMQNGQLVSVQTPKGAFACETLVLAVGHSARDTFAMLKDTGFTLQAKPFSVGFRAEHLQSRIEESLYRGAAGHPALPRGEYQLSQHIGGRCVYTFCMCPGGEVVAAASEENGLVTNGMSLHARAGKNANAAVVVSVNEADFHGDAMEAIAFQRTLEQAAFAAGGGDYTAPAENVQSFLKGDGTLQISDVQPTYPRGVAAANLGALLPKELADTLRTGLAAFEQKLSGYTAKEAVLTGLETRTSSPVRLPRSDNGVSLDCAGVYPCGEGAGYAGGIMSAATDGLRMAKNIMETFCPKAGRGRES
ncbi:MAG: FAD-dependent oxidoreductase [Ruthenibacterium sp.]